VRSRTIAASTTRVALIAHPRCHLAAFLIFNHNVGSLSLYRPARWSHYGPNSPATAYDTCNRRVPKSRAAIAFLCTALRGVAGPRELKSPWGVTPSEGSTPSPAVIHVVNRTVVVKIPCPPQGRNPIVMNGAPNAGATTREPRVMTARFSVLARASARSCCPAARPGLPNGFAAVRTVPTDGDSVQSAATISSESLMFLYDPQKAVSCGVTLTVVRFRAGKASPAET
jgi:hypothetical protein